MPPINYNFKRLIMVFLLLLMFRSCFPLNIHHFHSQRLVGFVVGIGAYWLAMSSVFTQTHTHTQRLSVILSKCIISVVVVILYIIRKIYFN